MPIFTVGQIEQLLYKAFSPEWAMPDDRFGLFVGDRSTLIGGIAIALDATVPMIKAAAEAKCNLLVTHHPPFWDAPRNFTASVSAGKVDGAAVYAAASEGVALLAMHTNIDCAPKAAKLLLTMMELEQTGPLKVNGKVSLGQMARPQGRSHVALRMLALDCERAFGQVAKVWGDPTLRCRSIAVCSGGASEVVPDVLAMQPDCFITGELRHHECLYLVDAGIGIIELGHDLSELPYRQLIWQMLVNEGVSMEQIQVLEPSARWWLPGDEKMETHQ